MAAVIFFISALLFCTTQSQKYGPGIFPLPIPRITETSNSPCTETYISSGPVNTLPNLNTPCGIANSIPNYGLQSSAPCNQPCLNNIPPFIQNQPTLVAQPMCNSSPTIVNVPSCNTIPQQILNTPSSFTNVPAPSIVSAVPTCSSTPAVTTVIDNTLANSLANAIQLLIVSNLLENTLGNNNANCGCANLASNVPCINNYDVLTPDFTSVPAISCDYPINMVSFPDPVCSFQEPVYSFPDPMICIPEPAYQTPCVDYTQNCGPTFSVIDSNCGQNQYLSQISPVSTACEVPVVASISPMALEVPFPAAIPAQLTCNFGYLNSNVPCVSFNVEPLPCSNMQIFGNYGNYV